MSIAAFFRPHTHARRFWRETADFLPEPRVRAERLRLFTLKGKKAINSSYLKEFLPGVRRFQVVFVTRPRRWRHAPTRKRCHACPLVHPGRGAKHIEYLLRGLAPTRIAATEEERAHQAWGRRKIFRAQRFLRGALKNRLRRKKRRTAVRQRSRLLCKDTPGCAQNVDISCQNVDKRANAPAKKRLRPQVMHNLCAIYQQPGCGKTDSSSRTQEKAYACKEFPIVRGCKYALLH